MAYSPDAVRAKLASLNETQDSIVANAQWIMFHRRHADRTAHLWLERLQSAAQSHAKKLNLIYLANEVVQQSRARGKQDFLLAFEPLIAEAVGVAYKGASQEVQGKIRRVVDVWRQRSIFDGRVVAGIEGKMGELDKAKGGKSGGKLGGSLFGGGGSGGGGGVPLELEGVSRSLAAVRKAEAGSGPAMENAEREFGKMTDPNATLPTPPVHAARLSALMRNLASAQGAVEASIKARRELLEGLTKLVENNRSKLAEEETAVADLATKREGIEAKKKEVEDGIMRGLSAPTSPEPTTPLTGAQANGAATNGGADPTAPEAEGFTPPPPDVETFTPPPPAEQETDTGEVATLGGPADFTTGDPEPMLANPTGAENLSEYPPNFNEPSPAFEPPPALQTGGPPMDSTAAANDFLATLDFPAAAAQPLQQQQPPMIRQASGEIPSSSTAGNPGDPRLKRRKMSHKPSVDGGLNEEDIFGAGTGVDEDGVAAMLAR